MAIRLPRANERTITACRDDWLTAALEVRQVEGERCQAAVATLFEAAGLARPPCTWVISPVAGAREIHRSLYRDGYPWDTPLYGIWTGPEPRLAELRSALDRSYEAGLSAPARRKLDRLLLGPLRRHLEPLRSWLEVEVSRRLDRPRPFHAEMQMPVWPKPWHHAIAIGGSFLDISDVAAHDCARRLGLDYGELDPVLDAFIALAEVGYWWPYQRLTVLCARPLAMHFDELGRPHAADGPAIAFGPSLELFAWHGAMVPRRVVDIRMLSAGRILDERNAELRRMMLERYGLGRFRQEARARRLQQDRWGTLWQVPVHADEPVVTVEVVNSTPEPDGTFSRYELRVPPRTRTALEGVAWTFGMSPAEYAKRLSVQT